MDVKTTQMLRRLGVWYLTAQGLLTIAWWMCLLLRPGLRPAFFGQSTSAAIAFSFIAPDLTVFVGSSLVGACGLLRGRSWAWPVLCLHVGSALYASLFSISLLALTGGETIGSLLMLPCAIVPVYLVWQLRPR